MANSDPRFRSSPFPLPHPRATGQHGWLESVSLVLVWLIIGAAVFTMGTALPLGAQELAVGSSSTDQVGILSVEQLGLGAATLTQSGTDLEAHLGRPAVVHRTTDADTGEPARIAVHRGLTAYLVAGRVMRLKTTEQGLATPAGIEVGARLDSVLGAYGPPLPGVRLAKAERHPRHGDQVLRYRVAGTEAYLIFHAYRGRVVAIELELDYA